MKSNNKKLINMCLYPKFITNRKYLKNKKNGGNPPTFKDERTTKVPVGCGNCIECRKQKAREWQVRLNEEIKTHKYNYFVTLTFSEESLTKLCSEANTTESNAVAGLAVRRFLERWRKQHGKSVKHWLITELGHEGTERIHLHGLIMLEEEMTKEKLEKYWQYGIADNGKYVNNRTINYIVKYVTKIDNDHKDYKAEIFCSAGLGANYLSEYNREAHKYKGVDTKEYYTMPNGTKINLPIYYRNKLWNEEQREQLWINKLDEQRIFVRGIECKIRNDEEIKIYNQVLKTQQAENKALGFGDDSKEWKGKEYNVTLKRLNAKHILQKPLK